MLGENEMMRRFAISAVMFAALVSCGDSDASSAVDNNTTTSSAVTLAQSPETLEQPLPPTSTTVPDPHGTDNEVPPNAVRELTEPPCDDEAACAAGFYLDGVFFGLDCTAIRTSAITAEVLGAGTVFGQQVTANVIADIDPFTVVAVSLPGGGACYEEDPSEPSSAWSLAIRQGASQDTIRDAVCAVADYTPERRLANGCEPLD